MNKYIVVHSGRRDDYQVALALAETNMLYCLVTDFYAPFDLIWFNLFRKILPNKLLVLMNRRYKNGLNSKKVKSVYIALFYSFLYRTTGKTTFSKKHDELLGKYAKKYSIHYACSIISMNTYAYYAFYKNPNLPKILFQFHPHPKFVKDILTEEILLNSNCKKSISQEYEFALNYKDFNRLSQEIFLADKIICASSITKKSIEKQGFDSKNVTVIPYGVENNRFLYRKRNIGSIFKVIFIGSLNQRKGITYLLDALENLHNVELTIIGRGIFDRDLLKFHSTKTVIFENVSFSKLLSLLHESYCFVLPSLIEGFGQAILEAMATGIPVIASENTIAKDIIENGKNGFLVPIRDSESIRKIIITLQENPELINQIGYEGFLTSKKYTWENFRKKLVDYIDSNK